jgi:hypothetical protein
MGKNRQTGANRQYGSLSLFHCNVLCFFLLCNSTFPPLFSDKITFIETIQSAFLPSAKSASKKNGPFFLNAKDV